MADFNNSLELFHSTKALLVKNFYSQMNKFNFKFLKKWSNKVCNVFLIVSFQVYGKHCIYVFTCLWKIERKKNFLIKIFPLSRKNLLCLWNILSMKCPIYEMSYLWNVLSMKCPIYEMSFYEMSQCPFLVWSIIKYF